MLAVANRRWRKRPMSEHIISLGAKVLVSGALLLVAAVLVWQVWRIWFSRTLVLAPFDFLEAGKPSVEAGEQFVRMIRADLSHLAELYNAGEVANSAAVPSTGDQEAAAPMEIPAALDRGFFEAIELKAYGIELGKLFQSLRRQIESPSEISGNVTHQGDRYSVFVELRQGGGTDQSPQRWIIQYAKDLPEATRGAACRIFRFLASSSNSSSSDAALFRGVDDEDFCLFNRSLTAYDEYRRRKAVLPAEEAAKLLEVAHQPIANLLEREVVTFPYVDKLAALIFYELKKYPEAEQSIERYLDWLKANKRADKSAEVLRTSIKSRKLQTTPATSRLRPLRPGSSIGPLGNADRAGMICCIVRDAEGHNYIVSATPALGSTKGTRIVQPAVRDGGTEADFVAELENATPTFAIARLREGVEGVKFNPEALELGAFKGFESKPKEKQVIWTYGLDGKRREGEVVSVLSSLRVKISTNPEKSIEVKNTVVTSDISSGGEIGAPVITADGRLVGMIFAAGGPTTLVLAIEPVLSELKYDLVK